MESGRLFFDHASGCHAGNMLFLGNGDHIFRGSRSIINIDESHKKRPFFSSPEDLYDEEYYDEQSPEKKRRLTPEQVHQLEKSFETENKLEPDRKSQLAKKLGLQPRQVAVWFQNRRARWKTKNLERDYDILKSNYDSLLAKYDSIHKENEKLKSEMASLTERLQGKDNEGGVGPPPAVQNPDPLSGEAAEAATTVTVVAAAEELRVKVEDRLSTGSGGGSAVVDVAEEGLQLLDSGDSYFHYGEDDSDDGRNYFSGVFAATGDDHQEEGETMGGWWVWSN